MTELFTDEKIADVVADWWVAAAAGQMGEGSAGDALIDGMLRHVRSGLSGFGNSRALRDALRAEALRQMSRCGQVYLYTDYGPDGLLAQVFRDAGASAAFLPVKTDMTATRAGVTVSVGYRGATRRLLGQPFYRVTLIRRGLHPDAWDVYLGQDEQEATRLFEVGAVARNLGGAVYLSRDDDVVRHAFD